MTPTFLHFSDEIALLHQPRDAFAADALAGLAEIVKASLRWRQYDRTLEPLGGLSLEHTKTDVPRRVPVHPTLARVLAEWTGRLGTYVRPDADGR